MNILIKNYFIIGCVTTLFVMSCSKKQTDTDSNSESGTNYSVSGSLSSLNTQGYIKTYSPVLDREIRVLTTKTISHIMAISPQTSNPERFIGVLSAAGQFSLDIKTGAPYIFVFLDSSKVGDDMIVGIFDPGDDTTGLDTLVPKTEGGSTDLGSVTVDGTTQKASMQTSFSEFLTALGIDNNTASTIGAVDDLTLRAANPDIDSNGVIDQLENKSFWLDFHLRTNTNCNSGCSNGGQSFSTLDGAFASDAAGFAISPSLKSIYAVHTTEFDATDLATYFNSGVSTTLNGGAAFSYAAMTASSATIGIVPTGYSGGTFGSHRQWGPDYSSGELPGYDGLVKMIWTTGNANSNKNLTYSHVRTRPLSQLFTFLPDIKFNTSAGLITSMDYRWRKWSGSAWVNATSEEVSLIISSTGAYISLYTQKDSTTQKGVGINIPVTSATGSIAWTAENVNSTSDTAVAQMTLADFCSGTGSYDDKLGLRNFVHNFRPITSGGPALCP